MRSRFWLVVALLAAGAGPAFADVEFDGSIGRGGPAPTRSAPGFSVDYVIPYDERDPLALRYGALAGPNLFQSLDRLNLLATERATFQALDAAGNPLNGIDRVIARITSGNPSLIEGVLRSEVMGDGGAGADLFLINPSGIIFRGQGGLRAQLDLPGSFTASTANFLRFADGTSFDASTSSPPSSLSAAPVSAFGFLAGTTGDVRFENTQPFEVASGETLRVVARNVAVTEDSTLQASGGELQLAAAGGGGVEVPLEVASWSVEGAPEGALGTIVVEGFSDVRASNPLAAAAPQGRIVFRGGQLVVEDSAVQAGGNGGPGALAIDAQMSESIDARQDARLQVFGSRPAGLGGARLAAPRVELSDAGTFVGVRNISAPAGEFRVEGDTIRVTDGAVLGTQAFGSAPGASLALAAEDIEVERGARVESAAFGTGSGGPLSVEAGGLRVDDARIEARAGSNGDGGDLTVSAGSILLVAGGQLLASTVGDRDAGNVTVTAVDRLEIRQDSAGNPSGIFARTGDAALGAGAGAGGDILIDSPVVLMVGDSAISARSLGAGNPGSLEIRDVSELSLQGSDAGIPEISARAFDGDTPGTLTIDAESISILDGAQVTASTLGTSPAGTLVIEGGDLDVRGTNAAGSAAGIVSQSNSPDADGGDAGNVDIVLSGGLRIGEGGEIAARSRGGGEAGSIRIAVGGAIELDGGVVTAEARNGDADPAGGNIDLSAGGGVRIQNGGGVSARSIGTQDAGRVAIDAGPSLVLIDGAITTDTDEIAGPAAAGGQIEITATDLIELVNSRLTTSVQGREGDESGGDITLDARFVVVNRSGILAQAVLGSGGNIRIVAGSYLESSDSLVDASSEFGVDGTVVVEAPEAQLKNELVQLPMRFLDAAALLRGHCAARVAGRGSFVIAGTEGYAAAPDRALPASMPLPAAGAPVVRGPAAGGTAELPALRLAAADCEALARAFERREARR